MENKTDFHQKEHSMKRRSKYNNYNQPGTYMLTLVVEERRQLLGTLRMESGTGQMAEKARVELSSLGAAVLKEEIAKISFYYPNVEVWKTCVMPDHLHIIVRVKEEFPKGKHLGSVIAGFKYGCTQAYLRLMAGGQPQSSANQPQCPAIPSQKKGVLFEKGYNDRILHEKGQLEKWKRYLDDNARRLALKKLHPNLFTVKQNMTVAGLHCQIIGNIFLLDIPDKMAVVVHRRDNDEEYEKKKQQWLACGERGGVLISAAIAQREKAVMREAMDNGYRVILLRENGFPPLYKPAGEAFDACARGKLLQMCPWEYHGEKRTISREQCLALNRLAEAIAGGWDFGGRTAENSGWQNC